MRETINSEMQQEKERFRSEIKLLKSLLAAEEAKNAEVSSRHKQTLEYAETLESRLADSEVAQEEVQLETERLQGEIETLKGINSAQLAVEAELREQIDSFGKEGARTVEVCFFAVFLVFFFVFLV